MARKLLKTDERILAYIRKANEAGALAGLGPRETERFVKRLVAEGHVVWVETKARGKGWALPSLAARFEGL